MGKTLPQSQRPSYFVHNISSYKSRTTKGHNAKPMTNNPRPCRSRPLEVYLAQCLKLEVGCYGTLYVSEPERDQGVHFFIKHKSIVV